MRAIIAAAKVLKGFPTKREKGQHSLSFSFSSLSSSSMALSTKEEGEGKQGPPLQNGREIESQGPPEPKEEGEREAKEEEREAKEEEEREEEEGRGGHKRLKRVDRIELAWEHWRKLGEPKFVVAPMVDQSELPFRMLCRKYGATAAYTPMLHARLFAEDPKYRKTEFTTCPEDRPLFVQFCANNPETLLEAASHVEPYCDYVDINLGCPQRIAKRGNYGAFLMDNLPLVRSLVQKLASNLTVPVSCKIRVFPDIKETLSYARMLEDAGCSLLAVHGRTRDQKDSRAVKADWAAIRAVKESLCIPVLANGNIRTLEDVHNCLRETGADGVLSAESLLENPAIFAGYGISNRGTEEEVLRSEEGADVASIIRDLDQPALLLEYLDLCEKYPVPWRMVRGHVHRLLGSWFKLHTDIRERLNKETKLTSEFLRSLVLELMAKDTRIPLLLSQPIDTTKASFPEDDDRIALSASSPFLSKSAQSEGNVAPISLQLNSVPEAVQMS